MTPLAVGRRARANHLVTWLITLLVASTSAPLRAQSFDSTAIDARDRFLWDSTLAFTLRASPWRQNPYDAGHALMIPLHAAFILGDTAFQGQFTRMFARMLTDTAGWTKTSPLDRLQFTYLIGRFTALAYQTGRVNAVPVGLLPWLRREFLWWWSRAQVLRSDGPPFTGEADRLRWLLSPGPVTISYQKLWSDQDWYVLGLAADLRTVERLGPATSGFSVADAVTTALDLAERCFRTLTATTPDSGIVLQPGVWRDYPDYAYSAYTEPGQDLLPRHLSSGSWDSSHSMRLAAIVLSLASAAPPTGEARQYYDSVIRRRLVSQLQHHVFVPPSAAFPAWRLTNYMDGSNGLFRWHRSANGEFTGVGPYGLSGSLILGWWSLLGGAWIRGVYLDEVSAFPLSHAVGSLYDAPGVAERGKTDLWNPASSFSRERELTVRLAAKISNSPLLTGLAP